MIRKYYNHTLQTNPWHHEEEQQNINNNTGSILKVSEYDQEIPQSHTAD